MVYYKKKKIKHKEGSNKGIEKQKKYETYSKQKAKCQFFLNSNYVKCKWIKLSNLERQKLKEWIKNINYRLSIRDLLLILRHIQIKGGKMEKDIAFEQYPKESQGSSTNVRQNRLLSKKVVLLQETKNNNIY